MSNFIKSISNFYLSKNCIHIYVCSRFISSSIHILPEETSESMGIILSCISESSKQGVCDGFLCRTIIPLQLHRDACCQQRSYGFVYKIALYKDILEAHAYSHKMGGLTKHGTWFVRLVF